MDGSLPILASTPAYDMALAAANSTMFRSLLEAIRLQWPRASFGLGVSGPDDRIVVKRKDWPMTRDQRNFAATFETSWTRCADRITDALKAEGL